jgi:hypothetical protein
MWVGHSYPHTSPLIFGPTPLTENELESLVSLQVSHILVVGSNLIPSTLIDLANENGVTVKVMDILGHGGVAFSLHRAAKYLHQESADPAAKVFVCCESGLHLAPSLLVYYLCQFSADEQQVS